MHHDFFKKLPAFTRFEDAHDPVHYQPLPEDWSVVVADIKESTRAIQEGRYKHVNMLGAACITVAVNACPDIALAYVFGGDGATILVPNSVLPAIVRELQALTQHARTHHALELRVGAVPSAEITRRGKTLGVAKYQTPTGCVMAMLRGGGAQLADTLVKHEGFALTDDSVQTPPNLEGLSCRWQPIHNTKGTMLTLLVMARESQSSAALYGRISAHIFKVLGEDHAPVQERKLRYSWPGRRALQAAKMVWQRGELRATLKAWLTHVGMILLFHFLHLTNVKMGGFNVARYRAEMVQNTDYRKFDDLLRMVVDCTKEKAVIIKAYLAEEHAQGHVFYGTHDSAEALMTCFVPSTSSDAHIHFIDGNDGGYALAAQQMKQQIAAATNSGH